MKPVVISSVVSMVLASLTAFGVTKFSAPTPEPRPVDMLPALWLDSGEFTYRFTSPNSVVLFDKYANQIEVVTGMSGTSATLRPRGGESADVRRVGVGSDGKVEDGYVPDRKPGSKPTGSIGSTQP